jgi:hypothetical protein
MPMTTESHTVLCGQCHRTVAVAVSNMHLPCFRNVEEQADCPEIAQRRGSGEETLLTMMCRALTESLAENLGRRKQVLFARPSPRAGRDLGPLRPSRAGAAISQRRQ